MRILLAIDGSEASDAALGVVASRPWPNGSVIRVLSVAENTFPAGPGFPEVGANYEPVTLPLVEEAEKVASRAAESLASSGLFVTPAVRLGEPQLEIVDEARQWEADLVVVGSHGRTGIARWVLGSVAEYVVRHAHCSVEVARRAVQVPERKPA